MRSVAGQIAVRLGSVLLAALFVGLFTDRLTLALLAAVALYLLTQLRNLYLLDRWLRRRSGEDPPDMGGPWGEVIAIVHRIYRRKQFHRQRALRLLKEIRRFTSAMPDGAVLLGPNREILWFNRTAANLLKLRRKLDVGMRIENLVRHPEFIGYLEAEDRSAPATIRDAVTAGQSLSFHLIARSRDDQEILLIRDVSREARVEAMRRDFVANASHELRSPLTVLAGYLDTLDAEQQLDASWSEPVKEMRRQSQRMHSVINDLLELSRLEASESKPTAEMVDVAGILSVLRKEALSLENRPQTIAVQLDSDAYLKGSEAELHSVFSNLLSNAIKYTPREGRIDIRWWVDEAGGHVSMQDTGFGIAPEHIPRLTERFYRVDAGRSREMGGSGLGLAIVKHVLQRHKATLAVDSVEGKGSTFTCHFPPAQVLTRALVRESEILR